MIEAIFEGLSAYGNPSVMGFLCVGLIVGAVVAILPGLGGVVGFSVVLPFVWGMDPKVALAFLIGTIAIMRTADTIPAVLFAVPGTTGCMPTVVEGYPMARRGEAARALGAAFSASLIGGIFGGIVLAMLIPVARPLVRLMGSPEFFMLAMWGVSMVGVLAGKRPTRGITAGLLGLLLASVGGAPGAHVFRYTFGIPYLVDGLSLVVIALGIFALPELVEMVVRGTQITEHHTKMGVGLRQGIKDTLSHIPLILRSSALGTFIGFLPGLGTTPASWMAYGQVIQTSKDRRNFGKGDIRGLIAPEAANNAADSGAFIPTIIFGIPGSGSMAVFLFALMVLGYNPGPAMLTTQLSATFQIIWGLIIGNTLGCILSIIISRPMARLTNVPVHYLMPIVLLFVILGAFQATQHWGDFITLMLMGALGWIMKQAGWPRPPVLIGFVLGTIAEKYMWISVARYGWGWLLHPGVVVISVLIIVSLFFAYRFAARRRDEEETFTGGEGGEEIE